MLAWFDSCLSSRLYCIRTSLLPERLASRSAAHGDIVVPSHRTDWGMRSFAVAGPKSWNVLPFDLRSSSFKMATFTEHWKYICSMLTTLHALLSLYCILTVSSNCCKDIISITGFSLEIVIGIFVLKIFHSKCYDVILMVKKILVC